LISQLPKWVEVGAFILALVAGFVNAIGLLSFEHQSVSHLSSYPTRNKLCKYVLSKHFSLDRYFVVIFVRLNHSRVFIAWLNSKARQALRYSIIFRVSFVANHAMVFICGFVLWALFCFCGV